MQASTGTSAASNPHSAQACGCGESWAQAAPLPRAVAWLQWITLAWMALECTGSFIAASQAHSVALLAFGSDSLIEFLSAVVVLLQFLPRFPLRKTSAERIAAVLLYALAITVLCIAAVSYRNRVETSCLGIGVTALALVAMPVLAWFKRRYARAMNNRTLAADATQSATCAYLAAVTLGGLAINAVLHISWVDSVAAIAAAPILILEGRRTWRGEGCGCAA